MQHHALLRVVLCEVTVERGIPPAFIAVVPEENRRMVYVMLNHLLDQLLANVGVVMPVPAAEFIEHVYAEFVAGIEEMAVRRVVAGTDRVAVQILYYVDVVSGDLRGQGPAGIGPETTST